MAEKYQEGIRSIPCFDQEVFTVGSCVHVLEINSETEEVNEFFGLIKNVRLDELVLLYFDSSKSIDAMKQKRIHVNDVLNKHCNIEVLKPRKEKERTDQLVQAKKSEHALSKIPFPHLSF